MTVGHGKASKSTQSKVNSKMVELKNTTIMIDTGQTNGKSERGNCNYDNYEKEKEDLVKNSKRNQIEGQQPHQRNMHRRLVDLSIVQKGMEKG